jgi:hypothetical protein
MIEDGVLIIHGDDSAAEEQAAGGIEREKRLSVST